MRLSEGARVICNGNLPSQTAFWMLPRVTFESIVRGDELHYPTWKTTPECVYGTKAKMVLED